MLLTSAEGDPTMVACALHCDDQTTVRNAIHDFNDRALAAPQLKSSRAHSTHSTFTPQSHQMLHDSRRGYMPNSSGLSPNRALDCAPDVVQKSHKRKPTHGDCYR